jgi:T-complex protein 1 subunit gamma
MNESNRIADSLNVIKSYSNIIQTTLGPRSMLKMIIDSRGNIIVTSDGNWILREIETNHPIAKSLIDLSKIQDQEIGDGTTSIVILSCEFLKIVEFLIKKNFHSLQIIGCFFQIIADTIVFLETDLAIRLNNKNFSEYKKLIVSTISTKLSGRFSRLICEISLKTLKILNFSKSLDFKKFIKIEKICGGSIKESKVLSGIMINKDISHPKMKKFLTNAKILLLDSSIGYQKPESQTYMEVKKNRKCEDIVKSEENYIIFICKILKNFNPDIIVTEKSVSDLGLHYLYKEGITVVQRVKKSDNHRISKITGGTIVSSVFDLETSDLGFVKKFFVKKICQENYIFLTNRDKIISCTILLFGPSRDVLDEIERNLQDALEIVKNINKNPKILPGGGATEMAIEKFLLKKAGLIKNSNFYIYKSIALGFEIIPKILIENCGVSSVSSLNILKYHHANDKKFFGIDGKNGNILDTRKIGLFESFDSKIQLIKSSLENCAMLLRVDRYLKGFSGIKSRSAIK